MQSDRVPEPHAGGAGQNYWGWNAGVTCKGWGAGYGQTSYGASEVMGHQLGTQRVGTYTAYFNHNSFSLSNDLWGNKVIVGLTMCE